MTGSKVVEAPAQPVLSVVVVGDEVAQRRVAGALHEAGVKITAGVSGAENLARSEAWELADALILVYGRSLEPRNTAIRRLSQPESGPPIVLIAPADSRGGVRSALEAGAEGVVFEADIETALVPTLKAVAAGQVAVPSDARYTIYRPTLSGREKEALALVVSGLTNAEIATRLYLAESTIKCHLSSAFAKLGVRSRHEAAQLILDSDDGLAAGIMQADGSLAKRASLAIGGA